MGGEAISSGYVCRHNRAVGWAIAVTQFLATPLQPMHTKQFQTSLRNKENVNCIQDFPTLVGLPVVFLCLLKVSLSLYLSLSLSLSFFGQVMSLHHPDQISQRSLLSRYVVMFFEKLVTY